MKEGCGVGIGLRLVCEPYRVGGGGFGLLVVGIWGEVKGGSEVAGSGMVLIGCCWLSGLRWL